MRVGPTYCQTRFCGLWPESSPLPKQTNKHTRTRTSKALILTLPPTFSLTHTFVSVSSNHFPFWKLSAVSNRISWKKKSYLQKKRTYLQKKKTDTSAMGIRKKKTAFFLVKRKKKTDTSAMDKLNGSDIHLKIDFKTIRVATGGFSDENKIGEGGFGVVYKGCLPDGKEIAVKRLSKSSRQGPREFMKEVEIIPKLQHRNLVQLYGYCVKASEKMLVYKYVPNRSLAHFLFDPDKRPSLDWDRRFKIIGGIARGLLYIHEDSRLKIIHFDLKASNILLDANMIPKISDFGIAKIIEGDETSGITDRIAGTSGYMAPEYVMHGQFSVKSDVYSFGVLLLEIISTGQKNAYKSDRGGFSLISYVWKAWNDGTIWEIIDSSISEHCSRSEVVRCIHIGLLCVQEDATSRPFMSSVVMMLTCFSLALPAPSTPAYYDMKYPSQVSSEENHLVSSSRNSLVGSINKASFTTVHATLY